MPTYDKTIGRNIRDARKAKGLTQEEMAEQLGVSAAYVGKLERGERTVNIEKLAALVPILQVPIETFVQGSVPIESGHPVPDNFMEAVREITKGCTQQMLQMMLDVLIVMARHDKEN